MSTTIRNYLIMLAVLGVVLALALLSLRYGAGHPVATHYHDPPPL